MGVCHRQLIISSKGELLRMQRIHLMPAILYSAAIFDRALISLSRRSIHLA